MHLLNRFYQVKFYQFYQFKWYTFIEFTIIFIYALIRKAIAYHFLLSFLLVCLIPISSTW